MTALTACRNERWEGIPDVLWLVVEMRDREGEYKVAWTTLGKEILATPGQVV